MSTITAEEKKALKGLGILCNRDGEHFSMRMITGNGIVSGGTAKLLSEAAEKYGNGSLALTSRMTVEIQGIPYENIAPLRAFAAQNGLEYGGTGPKIRPVVSCKGTVCVFGLIDTQGLAQEIHEMFYEGWHDVVLPHKFKIAVGGCPNNCIKPDLNDFGVSGRMVDKQRGYRVYLGGRWGKVTRHGTMLDCFLTEPAQVFELLEKTLLLFREWAYQGERFGAMLERIGPEVVEKELLHGNILARKADILAMPLLQKP